MAAAKFGLGFVGPLGRGDDQRLERFNVIRKGQNGFCHGRSESARDLRRNRKTAPRRRRSRAYPALAAASCTEGCASRSCRGRQASWAGVRATRCVRGKPTDLRRSGHGRGAAAPSVPAPACRASCPCGHRDPHPCSDGIIAATSAAATSAGGVEAAMLTRRRSGPLSARPNWSGIGHLALRTYVRSSAGDGRTIDSGSQSSSAPCATRAGCSARRTNLPAPLAIVADQIDVDPEALADYASRGPTRYEQFDTLRDVFGFRQLIPTALSTDLRLGASRDRGNLLWGGDQGVPSCAAGIEDRLADIEHAVREVVLAQQLPDVLDQVQLGAVRRQRQQGKVVGNDQLAPPCQPAPSSTSTACAPGPRMRQSRRGGRSSRNCRRSA